MFLKKYKVISIMLIVILMVFGISYRLTTKKYGSKPGKNPDVLESPDKYTIISNVDQILSSNTRILLKLRLKDSKAELEVKSLTLGNIQNEISGRLTLRNVEEHFSKSAYKLSSRKDDTLIFIKESTFEPGKYYLGATADGFIAVFICDLEGNLIIEDPVEDISSKKVTDFPINDQKYLSNFEFKFDSKEEAKEEFIAIIT